MDEKAESRTSKAGAAYIVAVDMGYGHQRAAFPLLETAAIPPGWNIDAPIVISANNYPGIPLKDKWYWEGTRKLYEWVSRANGFPVFGKQIFHAMDYFERIAPFYPRRDLSKPPFQLRSAYWAIRRGFGRHLIQTLNKNPLPLVTSFFIPAFFAEEHGYKGPIYCLCTDTDISRMWVPLKPRASNIIYLAPTHRVQERLKLYGVRPEKIIVTGFPLPRETLGEGTALETLRSSLRRRIAVLDRKTIYQKKYHGILSMYLGEPADPERVPPLTLTFAVGGAGAQWEIGITILKSLADHIKMGVVRLNLVAGSSNTVRRRFETAVAKAGLQTESGVRVIYNSDKIKYLKEFNTALIGTDILWTKPSELSFYVGLGLPVIMTPALGAQEEFNKAWLLSIGAAFEQDDPRYVDEWLSDWLDSGWLAEAAMNGFMDAPKRGTQHIEELIIHGNISEIEDIHFL